MQIRQFPEKEVFCQLAEENNIVPVCTEILADTDTPVSLLKKFQGNGKPVFLLESVEGGEKWGRYSFLGISARCHLKVYQDTVTIQENGDMQHVDHHNDPLEVLKTYMEQYKTPVMADLPRFWGGLVGYLTYEMVSFFETIPNRQDSGQGAGALHPAG